MASFPRAPEPGRGKTGRNWEIPGPTKNLASRKEPIFFRVARVRLHFDDKLASQGEDTLQATRRFERGQREEEVDEAVAAGQHDASKLSVKAVTQGLFTGL